jgi:exodeoxyribonuclease III
MRIITLNLNGIRSATKKGFLSWATKQDADFICVQETRAQLQKELTDLFQLPGYLAYFHDAEKKGYSGVGIYSKHQPHKVKIGLGWPAADQEGRYVELDFTKLKIASIYIPSGTSGELRQNIKYDFLEKYYQVLEKSVHNQEDFIISGDINIAHKNIDIKNWRANQTHSGFLPAERAWLDQIFDKLGLVDAFRVINSEPDQYTWWSNFGRAWEKNVGWRIDYQLITANLKNKVQAVSIYKKERFSDHAPVIIDYDYKIND